MGESFGFSAIGFHGVLVGRGPGFHKEAEAGEPHRVRTLFHGGREDVEPRVEGGVLERDGPAAPAVDTELGDRRLQLVVGPVPGEGLLGDVDIGDGGADERGGLLVRGHAVLSRRRGAGRAIQVRRPERSVRGAAGRGEGGVGAGLGDVFRGDTERVPGGGVGGAAAVCGYRVGHGFQGHEDQGGVLCDAALYGGLAGGFQCCAWICVWNGCLLAFVDEKVGDQQQQTMFCNMDECAWDSIADSLAKLSGILFFGNVFKFLFLFFFFPSHGVCAICLVDL